MFIKLCLLMRECRNVMAVMATGGGKTVLISRIIKEENAPSLVIAHRNSLVAQISRSLNKNEVEHRIIAQPSVIREIIKLHHSETNCSYYNPTASCGVCSLRTLLSKSNQLSQWLSAIRLWVTDEAHHLLKDNSWGDAIKLLPNAKGLGVTATPCRTDGAGLGADSDGVFNTLVESNTQREMILDGWLVNYVLYAPPSDADYSGLKVTKSGDYAKQKLRLIEKKSHLVGDVVDHYKRLAFGKLGVTFASNIKTAQEITNRFNDNGIVAKLVHADTPEVERFHIERQFKAREVIMLVNVDLFGEGYDLPQLEVLILARKTDSFNLFVQMVGRVLRPIFAPGMSTETTEQRLSAIAASDKPHGIIIDHASNIARHGRSRYCEYTNELYIDLCYAKWSLDRRKKRAKADPYLIPSMTCPECTGEYPGTSRTCPYCGFEYLPAERTKPEHVKGDLELLQPESLRVIQEAVNDALTTPLQAQRKALYAGLGPVIARRNAILQNRRIDKLYELGDAIDLFGGYQRYKGRTDSEAYRLFYFWFDVDILTARSLKTKEAKELLEKINNYLSSEGLNYGQNNRSIG